MSSEYIGIEDARKRLGDLVTAAQQGADIVLTRNGRPVARLAAYQEDRMFTIEIQAANADRSIWQALAPAETTTGVSAEKVARDTATNQNIAEGDGWRVVVWDGEDTGAEPAFIQNALSVDIVGLTKRFGLPDHEQSAVAAWTGDPWGTTWTEEDADQLHQAWEADQFRIDAEQG